MRLFIGLVFLCAGLYCLACLADITFSGLLAVLRGM
jgi:hypothetical protein